MRAKYLVAGAAVFLIAAELGLRLVGLGNPVLYRSDPELEYLLVPSREYSILGKHYRVNNFSMRSRNFPAKKTDAKELRLLFLGDSIVNGGIHVDQGELATEILERELPRALGRPVVVGNASAESWGPPNELAYLKRFGLFEADALALVVSSHDAYDVPTFEPLDEREKPTHAPWSALFFCIEKLLPLKGPTSPAPAGDPRDSVARAISETFAIATAAKIPVFVFFHPEKVELGGEKRRGYGELERMLKPDHVLRDWSPALREKVATGQEVYRDPIHLNASGQAAVAGFMMDALRSLGAP